MPQISEVIKLYPGMSNTVSLKEFTDKEKNKARMIGYKPIKSHREIILALVKAFQPGSTFKSSLLTGHYGTGKSHLLLMLANIFSQTFDQPELQTFFKTFEDADKEIARQVKNIRGSGRYLVVIPDYASTDDFSENLMTALEEAMEREGLNTDLNTIYKEALRYIGKLKTAEDEGNPVMLSAFTANLESAGTDYLSLDQIKTGLKNNKKDALDLFKLIYKRITLGSDFRYSSDNIIKILKDLIETNEFKERFSGVVFLYDEFDYSLKNKRISVEVVQDFAELCKNSNKIIFVGAMHKQLSAYANEYSVEDFRVVQARFKPIDMRTEGLEEVVSAIVKIEENNTFKTLVEPQLKQLYSKIPDIRRLNLFDWLDEKEIESKIIKAVYPLHPLSMYCLLQLSKSVGSSNRTLFTFLGGEGEDENNAFSYKAFIKSTEIINNQNLLSLYTSDNLVNYFTQELDINNVDLSPKTKESVRAYHTSYRELNNVNIDNSIFNPGEQSFDHTVYLQIIKTMLVFDIVGIKINKQNIIFSLNLQIKDAKKVDSALKQLTTKKIIFHNSIADTYEFRKGTEIDWSEIHKIEKERLIAEKTYEIETDFLDIYPEKTYDKFLSANSFNSLNSSDYRLLRVFEQFKNFGQKKTYIGKEIDYFKYFEKVMLDVDAPKDNYEAVVIYVITESDKDIQKAREIAKKNTSEYVLIVIPEKQIDILDQYLNLKAAINIKNSDDYTSSSQADQSRFDETFYGDANSGYVQKFLEQRNKYLAGRNSAWYGCNNNIFSAKPSSDQEPVKQFLKIIYPKFNAVNDEELNRKHRPLTGNKESCFKEAIDTLLFSDQVIKINTRHGVDKGFIRYLKNVLYDKQLLCLVKKDSEDSMIFHCEVEKDVNKYKSVFPALIDMIDYFNTNKSIDVKKMINKFKQAPYGLSNVSLKLFVSFIVKYFGDELEYKKDASDPGEVQIKDYNVLSGIVENNNSLSVFNKRKLSEDERKFLNNLYNAFAVQKLSVSDSASLAQTMTLLKMWWNKLPTIAKTETCYEDNVISKLLQVFKTIDHHSNYDFIFCQLLKISGYPEDSKLNDEIVNQLLSDIQKSKEQIENLLQKIENLTLDRFIETFKVQGKTSADLKSKIIEWYNALDESQKDETESWQTKDSLALLRHLRSIDDISNVLYEKLPGSSELKLGAIKDWSTNELDNYISCVSSGLIKIEANRIRVDVPIVEGQGENLSVKKDNNFIEYKYDDKDNFKLLIKPPAPGISVWYTVNGDNPTESGKQKEIKKKEVEYIPKKESETLKLVSTDKDENHSQILTVRLSERSNDSITATLTYYQIDRPNDINEAKNTIKGLINKFIEDLNIDDKTDIAVFLKNLGEKFEK